MTLSQLSESCNNQKPFSQMTRDDILAYLNNCRKSGDRPTAQMDWNL
jgi:hypothetical protein